jgi:hypothetical protein
LSTTVELKQLVFSAQSARCGRSEVLFRGGDQDRWFAVANLHRRGLVRPLSDRGSFAPAQDTHHRLDFPAKSVRFAPNGHVTYDYTMDG